jgi:hypothetical protein
MPFIVAPIAAGIAALLPTIGPISLAAGAGFGIGTGTFAIATTAASVLVYGGLSVGLNLASSALQRSLTPDAPNQATPLEAINDISLKVNAKQATPFQRILYGLQRTGGPLCFYKVKGSKLYVQHIYSRRKLTGIVGVNLNGHRLSFAAPAFGTILTPIGVTGAPDFPSNVRACFQDGALDQATNPLLLVGWPDLPAGWRLPGIANAVVEYDFGATSGDAEAYEKHQALYGNTSIPNAEPEFYGAPVYDPRDPTQWLPEDPSDIDEWFAAQDSWKFSSNAKLIQADYLWQADGLNAGPTGVDWDKVADAANRDDELAATRFTATTGAYEKRYEIHGVVSLDQRSADVFDGMLTASRSTLIQGNDGACWIASDAAKTPVMTITDDMIIGDVAYRGFKSRHDLANRTVMRFVAPERKYQESEGPPLIRADLITADGGELSLNVTLPFTASSSMAQRIAKADLEDVRIETAWAGVLDLRALGIREDDCVRIASDICPHWNGLYVVNDWELVLDLKGGSGLAVKLTGYDPAICNDWNAPVDDQPFVITDTDELLAA